MREFSAVDRLDQIEIGSGFQSGKLVVKGRSCGEQNDPHIGIAPHIFGKNQTALVRKPNIDDGQLTGLNGELAIKLTRGGGSRNIKS